MTDLSIVMEFREHLRACTSCELHEHCTGPVPWRGDLSPVFAVMGEAPGKTEDRQGEPFVGDSGAILNHWLKITGFDAKKMAFMNAVQCWPVARSGGTPTGDDIRACRGWMNGQLEVIRPQVLITMGVTAYKAVRHGEKWPELKLVHGKPLRHPVYNFVVWPTYHPAAYLRGRSKVYETKIVDDLARLTDWWPRYASDEVAWPTDCYVCGDEFYNWDEWAIPLCYRHSAKQGILFAEDER